jgi:hypothetical protein
MVDKPHFRNFLRFRDLNKLKSEKFSCEICGNKENLVIDHNHKSNVVRGRLCNHCNRGLGHFLDNENLFTLGNLTFNIELWDAINITDQVNSNNLEDGTLVLPDKHKILCNVEVEKKKTIAPCGKKATHLSSDNKGVCKSHLGRDDTLAYYPITTKPVCIHMLPVDKKHSEPYQCSKKASCVEKNHYYKGYFLLLIRKDLCI